MDADPEIELKAEIDLLQRIGQGDRRSFEALYDRFSGVLFSTAYRALNNREAAEDVLQDVFIQIWEKAALYDSARGKPMTWAITLTRNKSIDRLRSTQRRNRLQDDLLHESETVEQFDDRSSFAALSSVETGGMVRAAIQKLSKDQREAIELAFFFAHADRNLRATGRAAGDGEGAHPPRDGEAEGPARPSVVTADPLAAAAHAVTRSFSSCSRAMSHSKSPASS